jgi:hypothetical protein
MLWLIPMLFFIGSIRIYNNLTCTEGWYKENWSTFFKRVIFGKLHCKEFNITDDRQQD